MVKTQAIVLISALLLLGMVLNLVRKRQLREEYSWLWLVAALFYLVMALKPDMINPISNYLGITNTITAFVFFGLLFIVLILIHYSVKLSRMATQMKDIAQQIAILDGEENKLRNQISDKDYKMSDEDTNLMPEHLIGRRDNLEIMESEAGKL